MKKRVASENKDVDGTIVSATNLFSGMFLSSFVMYLKMSFAYFLLRSASNTPIDQISITAVGPSLPFLNIRTLVDTDAYID